MVDIRSWVEEALQKLRYKKDGAVLAEQLHGIVERNAVHDRGDLDSLETQLNDYLSSNVRPSDGPNGNFTSEKLAEFAKQIIEEVKKSSDDPALSADNTQRSEPQIFTQAPASQNSYSQTQSSNPIFTQRASPLANIPQTQSASQDLWDLEPVRKWIPEFLDEINFEGTVSTFTDFVFTIVEDNANDVRGSFTRLHKTVLEGIEGMLDDEDAGKFTEQLIEKLEEAKKEATSRMTRKDVPTVHFQTQPSPSPLEFDVMRAWVTGYLQAMCIDGDLTELSNDVISAVERSTDGFEINVESMEKELFGEIQKLKLTARTSAAFIKALKAKMKEIPEARVVGQEDEEADDSNFDEEADITPTSSEKSLRVWAEDRLRALKVPVDAVLLSDHIVALDELNDLKFNGQSLTLRETLETKLGDYLDSGPAKQFVRSFLRKKESTFAPRPPPTHKAFNTPWPQLPSGAAPSVLPAMPTYGYGSSFTVPAPLFTGSRQTAYPGHVGYATEQDRLDPATAALLRRRTGAAQAQRASGLPPPPGFRGLGRRSRSASPEDNSHLKRTRRSPPRRH